MRRIRAIVGYIGMIVIFGGILIGGIRFAQQQPISTGQPPVVTNPDQSVPDEATRQPDPVTPPQSQSQPTPAQELPQTGIADGFLSALGLGMVAASAVAYAQSRRLSSNTLT